MTGNIGFFIVSAIGLRAAYREAFVMLEKIISGGQTGTDQAASREAIVVDIAGGDVNRPPHRLP